MKANTTAWAVVCALRAARLHIGARIAVLAAAGCSLGQNTGAAENLSPTLSIRSADAPVEVAQPIARLSFGSRPSPSQLGHLFDSGQRPRVIAFGRVLESHDTAATDERPLIRLTVPAARGGGPTRAAQRANQSAHARRSSLRVQSVTDGTDETEAPIQIVLQSRPRTHEHVATRAAWWQPGHTATSIGILRCRHEEAK